MKSILSVVTMLFLSAGAILALTKVWMPDMIDDGIFIKLGISFAILAVVSIALLLLSGHQKTEEKEEAQSSK